MKTVNGLAGVGGFALLHAGKHAADVFGSYISMPLGLGLKFLDDLRGAGHRAIFALNVDLPVLRRDRDRQCLADSPHMLIAGAEER